MRTRNVEVKISSKLTADSPTPKDFLLEATIYDDWVDAPKCELELILDQLSHKGDSPQPSLDKLALYEYLTKLGIEEAANKISELVIKRYILLRRTIPDENKSQLDEIFSEHHAQLLNNTKETNKKLKTFLSKEKIAVFHHINNAYSSIPLALTSTTEFGVRILAIGLHELYSGDQRYFRKQIKTRSEIATEGGIARRAHYAAAKEKACELLSELTPPEGWSHELDAFNAIIAHFEKYLIDNTIRYPALSNIKRTLRSWIKKDALVSAAAKIHSQPATVESAG